LKDTVSWALKAKLVAAYGAPGLKVADPVKLVERWVQMVSAENVRFLTGVHRVTAPSIEMV
jgi:hypothetical protein